MKRMLMTLAVAFLATAMDAALEPIEGKTLQEVAEKSQSCKYVGANGAILPYRLFAPKVINNKKYPLIVFLHGAGERGTDNVLQLKHNSPLRLTYEKCDDGMWRQKTRQAFVIFPQCAKESQWVLVPWGATNSSAKPAQPSPGLQNVHELVHKLQKEFPIDSKRIYVTGMSMGGYGTWDYMTRWPEDVAGAIVVCGGADNAEVAANPKVNTIPVKIFHGTIDKAVPVIRGRTAFNAVKEKNSNATYIEYGGQGHGIWNMAYGEPCLGLWLFNQRKK